MNIYFQGSTFDDVQDGLKQAFRVFDLDGDGFITRDELRIVMKKMGEGLTNAELDKILATADIDHDGKINYNEFVAIQFK